MASITQLEKDIRKGRVSLETYINQLNILREKVADSDAIDKQDILQAVNSAEEVLIILFKKEEMKKEMMNLSMR